MAAVVYILLQPSVHYYCITPDPVSRGSNTVYIALCGRHEPVNERLKNFAEVKKVFRHNNDLHVYIFHVVAQLVELVLWVKINYNKHTSIIDDAVIRKFQHFLHAPVDKY